MNNKQNEQETLRESLSLIYRLKENAESLRQESDLLLKGMRAILEAKTRKALYERMFSMFQNLIPYETCFVLNHDRPGIMRCFSATENSFEGTDWEVDGALKKALMGKPVAVFNAASLPSWQTFTGQPDKIPTSVLYCPFRIDDQLSIMVFCARDLGFYTQKHVSLAERYREFTEQTVLSVNAKLQALESEKLRAEKIRVEETMFKSEKMASLGLLAAGVAHELNNPVAYIKSNIEFLSDTAPMLDELIGCVKQLVNTRSLDATTLTTLINLATKDEFINLQNDLKNICNSVHDGTKRITDIVSSLRTFVESNERKDSETFNVNRCIENSLLLIASELKTISAVHTTLGEVPDIRGSAGKFNQIVVNLLMNAIHAMGENGRLEVRTQMVSHTLKDATISSFIVITIKDNGCGISAQNIDKLFEPFYTTKPVGEGMGLGLYITFTLIESLGGTISVNSELNIGSEFEVKLPCAS